MSFLASKKKFRRPKRVGLFGRLVRFIESKPISDRMILRSLFFIFIASSLTIGIILSNNASLTTPVSGGILKEGIIGIPRFVNPVLAVTRADQDMTALMYRGLMKINPDGELVPDLAESVTLAEDGKTYNVIIKKGIYFHDGTPLTARDVAFTIGLLQNADLKSPLRGNWVGVVVEEIGEHELNIVLNEAYTPFIENFTVGILPRHIWDKLPVEQIPFSLHNSEPIGTGPFIISNIVRNDNGLIDTYILKRFKLADKTANLAGVEVRFYLNETELLKALETKTITSTIYAPTADINNLLSRGDYSVISVPMPRIFGIFFNQNRSPALRDIGARLALASAISTTDLVNKTLSGQGVPIAGPIPALGDKLESTSSEDSAPIKAETILTNNGWSRNQNNLWEKRIAGEITPLEITIKTVNSPLFEQTARSIADSWRAIGVNVQVEQYEQSDLLQAVIRPRDFQALLFGLDMSRAVDLYPFWHSSQREDPGLNIAQYANIEVDSLLTKARSAKDQATINQLIAEAVTIIKKEQPAIFLYSPTLTYLVPKELMASKMTRLSKPHDRFMNIDDWYMETDNVWKFFK